MQKGERLGAGGRRWERGRRGGREGASAEVMEGGGYLGGGGEGGGKGGGKGGGREGEGRGRGGEGEKGGRWLCF